MTTREVSRSRRTDSPGRASAGAVAREGLGSPVGRPESLASRLRSPGRRSGPLTRRPDVLPLGATAAAWLGLAALTPAAGWLGLFGAPATMGAHGSSGGLFTPTGLAMVALMSVAMMGPLAVPGVRYVVSNSLWWRAGRAGLWFFGAFITTWAVIALCLQPVAELLAGVFGSASVAAGLLALVCALAQLDPRRAGRSATCDSPMRLRARGSDANTDCARFGLLCAARGFRLCALPMLAMFALPASLLVMASLTAFTVTDRVTQGRRRILIATLYTGLGVLLLL